ncbi:MAG: Asp-tRNA(Asn)/Glu-tRNA(Gln) amidotransferase subunit GatB, partial [bacterium]|nr:Asp-tRNA(Asn)/Glu-tRNA(Gln) amidotransferase subunit GatB [bacterium]
MKLETVIGLETHVQLKSKSKMFCACVNQDAQDAPNANICEVCTGQPGTLPVVNDTAVRWGVKVALALNCVIQTQTKFDRKNYFYPDLPKGYQISQFDVPLAKDGWYKISVGEKLIKVGITRAHLEEDAAKLVHPAGHEHSYVDFNRSGAPLVEIVTEPDFRDPAEAKVFLQELRLLMRYLGVSDADMEKGQLRCDANISLRQNGDVRLYPKTEIKNLNSFRSVEQALEYEQRRQGESWEKGEIPDRQTTRGWDEQKLVTMELRAKESFADYRYFPDPDLPPLKFTPEYIERMKAELPELPQQRRVRFKNTYALEDKEIEFIVSNKALANYVEYVISELRAWFLAENPKGEAKEYYDDRRNITHLAVNWLVNKLLKFVYEAKQTVKDLKITPENFAEFIKLIY